jgi:hypothetical protein
MAAKQRWEAPADCDGLDFMDSNASGIGCVAGPPLLPRSFVRNIAKQEF